MIANTCEKMKSFILFFLVFFSISATAQHVSGLYSGTLTNDSLKMIQNYELALSEYKGKITGYSYITFVANDTFYYGIKRVKATRENGELVVEDVEMLANNYPKRPDKGVHVINRIPLPSTLDTLRDVAGKWETTKTKKFYSISGAMSLRKDDDSTHSALIAHLKELDVINYQDEKKDAKNIAKKEVKKEPKDEVAINKPVPLKQTPVEKIADEKPVAKEAVANKITSNEVAQKTIANEPQKEVAAKQTTASKTTGNEVIQKPVTNEPEKELVPKETALIKPTSNQSAPRQIVTDDSPKEATAKQTPTVSNNNATLVKEASPKTSVVLNTKATVENKPTVIQSNTVVTAKPKQAATEPTKTPATQTSANNTPATNIAASKPEEKAKPKETTGTDIKQPVAVNAAPKEQRAASTQAVVIAKEKAEEVKSQLATTTIPPVLEKRASNTIQTVTVASDSLVLSFYDNGVVDGDSISVFVNHENVISKVKLKEAAVKKTIYIPNNLSETKLTLVAENLGSIPPNTGLLIIQDGNDRYQIRFSADMETNASVIIKKKR